MLYSVHAVNGTAIRRGRHKAPSGLKKSNIKPVIRLILAQ